MRVSVPFARGTPPWHLPALPLVACEGVSVPFARGTPPWRSPLPPSRSAQSQFQSPSRGGHLRGHCSIWWLTFVALCFSPLREGDTSVAYTRIRRTYLDWRFQSPSRGGHLRGLARLSAPLLVNLFQSPSRGGHLRGGWRDGHGSRQHGFQSPSRGGHLRGAIMSDIPERPVGFSPLREGDTSVAQLPVVHG